MGKFREYLREIEVNESKNIKDMTVDEIIGEVEYLVSYPAGKDSSILRTYIKSIQEYLVTTQGSKKINKALAAKLMKGNL